MSELKRTFTGGKMNKDLDERFVPKNQYRHALNLQVRQSDGDASGTAQNLQGNISIGSAYYADWMDGSYVIENFTAAASTLSGDGGSGSVGDEWTKAQQINVNDPEYLVCMGSIADEKTNNSYFFFTHKSEPIDNIQGYSTIRKFVDNIIEQNSNGVTNRIVNDHWATTGRVSDILPLCGQDGVDADSCYEHVNGITSGNIVDISQQNISTANAWNQILVKNGSDFRVGMTMHGYTTGSNDVDLLNINGVNPRIQAINGNLLLFEQPVGYGFNLTIDDNIDYLLFKHDRALNFQIKKRKHITGINIIDNLLFWTDNYSEPKKINIDRCRAGTFGNNHTKLFVEDITNNNTLTNVANITPHLEVHNAYYNTISGRWNINSDIKESHITVMKKAPTKAPVLEMSDSERASIGGAVDVTIGSEDGIDENGDTYYSFVSEDGEVGEIQLNVGDLRTINGDDILYTRFRKDDILDITEVGANVLFEGFITIKAKFICYEDENNEEVFTGPTTRMRVRIMSLGGTIVGSANTHWKIKLVERTPLFETSFCRFGYRYKYEDGEYSSFSPWSRLAFLPGVFDYSAKNGYNLGMTNNVRELIVRDFIPYDIPLDVVEIDILFKGTSNANVYIANTITKNKNPEWDSFVPQVGSTEITQGELYITSEMIHRVLPEMQTFRSWDNVPKYALAQEIVGNRLLYGNYFQGYNMENPLRLTQTVSSSNSSTTATGFPSIKSLRNYKIGMVFGDKYGRETPVFTNGYITNSGDDGDIAIGGDIYTDKLLSSTKNQFTLSQDWMNPLAPGVPSIPPDWAIDGGYIKYFVKETSNEYYNLVLDRWYDSGDESVWLSFNSADRNKIDESTHLILKNQHSTNAPVHDLARYKVLAIENEAPDYIKTRYINVGEVNGLNPGNTFGMWASTTSTDDQDIPPAGLYNVLETVPGQDGFSFVINNTTWNSNSAGWTDASGMGNIFGKEIEGDLEMQVIGRQICAPGSCTDPDGTTNDLALITYTIKSDWRKITHFSKDTNGVRLVWTRAYKDMDTGGVNMYGMFIALGLQLDGAGGKTLEYSVRFRAAIKENRPEFDGKFFVKVNRDTALVENVLELGIGMGGVYVPDTTYQLAYIDSQYMSNATGTMGQDPNAGQIMANSAFDELGGVNYTNWYNSFDQIGTNGWSPPQSSPYQTDPYFFDAPYWAQNLGPYGSTTNTPIGVSDYTSDNSDDSGLGYENMVGLLNTDYYGWEGFQMGSDFNEFGISPYMPFVPLEYVPNSTTTGDDINTFLFDDPSDSIWGVDSFVDWCLSCSDLGNVGPSGEVTGLQFVPGAGGPCGSGIDGTDCGYGNGVQTNPYGAGIFGGTCGPMFDWYNWNDKTKEYWQNYAVNYAPGGGQSNDAVLDGGHVFMDGAGARRYITTIKNDNGWGMGGSVVRDQSGNIIPDTYYYEYYKPRALEAGIEENVDGTYGTPADQFGRMNLGVTYYNYQQSTAVNKASLFFDKMTEVGTVFRFKSDPNQHVYKVIWVEDKAWYDDNTFGGVGSRMTSNVHSNGWYDQTTDGYVLTSENNNGFPQLIGTITNSVSEIGTSQCEPMQSNNEEGFSVGRRLNRTIEFRKLNLETGGTGGNAIATEEGDFFDPRAHVRHDGSSSMDVQIMRLGFNYDGDDDDSIQSTELGACFETEPKEDVGLDLYYEASNALPIVLNRDNMLNYVPIGSGVNVIRRTATGNLVKTIKFEGIDLQVGNVYGKRETTDSDINSRGVIVSLLQKSLAVPSLYKRTIWPTDTILFKHSDGVETQSKVLNFVEPIDNTGDGDADNNITTEEFASGVVENPRSFRVADTVTLELDPNSDNGVFSFGQTEWNDLDVDTSQIIGALVTGVEQNNVELTVPAGIFILNVVINSFEYEGTLFNTLEFGGDALGYVGTPGNVSPLNGVSLNSNVKISFTPRTGYYEIDPDVWKYPVKLGWFNCYSFGNGVESDRIRDDFNAPTIDNGVKVSSTATGYGEENKGSGIIYSGLYNSTSQMNDLNQFNMAEKITKDLNPTYGSIQALKTRDSDVVVLAEDKILKVQANKDAVYNADGNPQLIATNRVLGTVMPFAGEYGISLHPESLAEDQYRMYFTDQQRGAVLRLSRDGLTPISNVGMKTWFRSQLRKATDHLGTFDKVSGEYNLTLDPIFTTSKQVGIGSATDEIYTKTLSFSEESKGWVSFKSFVPEEGVSVSGSYITIKNGRVWKHYAPTFDDNGNCIGLNSQFGCTYRNDWYNSGTEDSEVIMVFNDQPSVVKSFKTLDYEGSQAKVYGFQSESVQWKDGVTDTFYDGEYNNLVDKKGWWADKIETDLEKGKIHEFKRKEGKWFHQIGGLSWNYNNSNSQNSTDLIVDSLDIQGLGITTGTTSPSTVDDNGNPIVQVAGCTDPQAVNYDPDANYYAGNCVYYGCSDYRKIGIDFLQNHPVYGNPDHEAYGNYLASNYVSNTGAAAIICENDTGQTFNINNFENGWQDDSGINLGPWTPTCCTYFACKDPNALNYIGDDLAPHFDSCTNAINEAITAESPSTYQACDTCEYDCGGGNIQGIGFDATCGCNDSAYIEYWTNNEVSLGVFTIEQPELLMSYNNLPYHYNNEGDCETLVVYGCTNNLAFNYNSTANVDDGSCVPITYGCIDQTMTVIDSVSGEEITVPTANYCDTCNYDDGGCIPMWPTGTLSVEENTND